MAIIEKQTNKKQKVTSVGKDAEKLEALCIAAGNKMVQLLCKTVLWFLKKLNIELSSDQIRSVVSDSLRPHESQHARPPCPSPTPGVHSDSRPSCQ